MVEMLDILASVLASAVKLCPDKVLHFVDVNELFAGVGTVKYRREDQATS